MDRRLIIPEEVRFKVADLTLAGLRWGKARQPTIIALHGWLDNAASFMYLAPLLKDYQVIALDMAGHGHSDYLPVNKDYKLASVADYILQVLQELSLSSAIFLGHSLGGVVASYLAAYFPQQVEKLIMLDAIGPLSQETITIPGKLQKSVQSFVAAEQRVPKDYASVTEMLKLRAKVNGVPSECLKPLVERAVNKTNQGYCWRFDPRLRLPSLSYFTEAEVLKMLTYIEAPTLIIEAMEGILANMEFVAIRKKALHNLTVVKLPGNHHLHLVYAAEVAQTILNFLVC